MSKTTDMPNRIDKEIVIIIKTPETETIAANNNNIASDQDGIKTKRMQENITKSNFYRINELALISIEGADAVSFLQGQLSADVTTLTNDYWARAAYCSSKGRMLASFIICRDEERFLAVLSADIADSIINRLRMFVLRAKVKLEKLNNALFIDNSDEILPATGDGVVSRDSGFFVICGDSFRFCPNSDNRDTSSTDNGNGWLHREILRGVPWISKETQEMFIPQFVNFDVLNGINFKKGCYVGQEIIARLHYLGGIKKRGMVLSGDGEAPQAGEKLSTDDGTLFAEVINTATIGDSFVAFAAVSKTAIGKYLQWHGRPIKIQSPPYGLPNDDDKQRPKV